MTGVLPRLSLTRYGPRFVHIMNISQQHLLVAGASGLVGLAAARHFASLPGWRVSAVSRRPPAGLEGVTHLPLDLGDAARAHEVLGGLEGVTHVLFAAYSEQPGTQGWREPQQMALNLRCFATRWSRSWPQARH